MDMQCEMPLVSAPEASLTDLIMRLDVQEDLAQVDHYMQGLVTSPVLTLSQPARHVVSAGGKRLRAALVLLAARLNDWPG
jgi:geranylgeranyl pyrophosphate synthase